jgi:hypothetical protein
MPGEQDSIAAAIRSVLASDAVRETPPPRAGGGGPEGAEQVIPNRRGYVLGWLAASLIVSDRYLDSAIDAIPVCHPEQGWDRMLLTRRISCNFLADEAPNAFGIIDLAASDAPRLTDPDGNVLLPLGELFETDVTGALNELRARFPRVGLVAGDHAACAHTRAPDYPRLYRVIARLLAEHPDVVAARELLIDNQLIDGAYHPLFIHTAERGANLRYDWFALQSSATGYAAFARINGRQSVYRTDRATWATPNQQLASLPEEAVRDSLLAWLRLKPGAAESRASSAHLPQD